MKQASGALFIEGLLLLAGDQPEVAEIRDTFFKSPYGRAALESYNRRRDGLGREPLPREESGQGFTKREKLALFSGLLSIGFTLKGHIEFPAGPMEEALMIPENQIPNETADAAFELLDAIMNQGEQTPWMRPADQNPKPQTGARSAV